MKVKVKEEKNKGLKGLQFYQMSLQLWDDCWNDTEKMLTDVRGRELAKQLIRSVGSVSANIEEGYGRGIGKEYPHFLKISRGSAQESRGWYGKAKFLLAQETIHERISVIDTIIGMETKTIQTLEHKNGVKDNGKISFSLSPSHSLSH